MVERETVNLYVRHDVRYIEAASYTQITPGLVHFRFKGAQWTESGEPSALRHVLAKVSRPEVAAMFMAPAPGALVKQLIDEGALTPIEGEIACRLPVAGDICVEADSGGHTDGRSPYPLMQAVASLRVQMMAEHGFPQRIRVGAAGGLGSPASLAAAFVLGSDFVLTGSVNQCTAEAGISDPAKDLLADLDVQDTAYAPAGDLFEQGARVQVVRKGTLFAARANKLYQLYRQLDGLEDLDPQTRATIEEHYFRRSFDEVWEETKQYLEKRDGAVLERAKQNPKLKMALVFRWYFVHSTGLAMTGVPGEQVNYQIHCGPALGAFNRLVADSHLQPWRARHVDEIAVFLMSGAAELLDRSLHAWSGTGDAPRALSARGG